MNFELKKNQTNTPYPLRRRGESNNSETLMDEFENKKLDNKAS